MHAYNDAMILELSRHLDPNRNWKVLDLAAGTGYNSIALSQMLPAAGFTLVDISAGMLDEARKSLGENASFVTDDMLHYLENCAANTFDVVVCGWAIKYRPPLQIIKQCQRVLRQDGYLAVIVNTKDTLPQVARIYPQLLAKHTGNISRLMLRLPNPKNAAGFDNWFLRNSFAKVMSTSGTHDFQFNTSLELAEFVISTGALAGFDVMLDLRDPAVQSDMVRLFRKHGFTKATHRFVYGVYKK
jgi:ubiquinone/menaquinone biosynthesis C-methylase UbiE